MAAGPGTTRKYALTSSTDSLKLAAVGSGTETMTDRPVDRRLLFVLVFDFPTQVAPALTKYWREGTNGLIIDDGDRSGECHYAIWLHGWVVDGVGKRSEEDESSRPGGMGWIARVRYGC